MPGQQVLGFASEDSLFYDFAAQTSNNYDESHFASFPSEHN
jgi:hypothetical protein